jgi:hypothetical protein
MPMKVPAFLLRRLYVKESLTATADGFTFQLRNRLGSGYARSLLPLTLDGAELAPEHCSFAVDGVSTPFTAVSADTPFTLGMNKTTTITYAGGAVAPGQHTIGMRFEVAGLGEMGFDFTATLG